MTTKTHDITELIFPPESETDIGRKKLELWRQSTEEAYDSLRNPTPMMLLKKTDEIYRAYLAKQGIKYDDERGL